MSAGVLPIVIAAVLWGLWYPLHVFILPEIGAVPATFITCVVASVCVMATYRLSLARIVHLFLRYPVHYGLLGFLGTAFATVAMLLALQRIDMGPATVLEKVQPVFTVLLAGVFLKERLSLGVWPYALGCLVMSCAVVVGRGLLDGAALSGRVDWVGVLCVILAAFSWATAGVLGRFLMTRGAQPQEVVLMRFSVGAVCLLPFMVLPLGDAVQFTPSVVSMGLVIGTAVLCSAVAYHLYYLGLRDVSAGQASFLELLTPLVSVVCGVFFLRESYDWVQVVGGLVLLLCVYKMSVMKAR